MQAAATVSVAVRAALLSDLTSQMACRVCLLYLMMPFDARCDPCVQAAPIVRVAVEAALPSELPRLVEGLRLLNRADPFLEVTLQDKGEYVLGAAGASSAACCVHSHPQWLC